MTAVGYELPGLVELRRREGALLRQLREPVGATGVEFWRHGADFAVYRVRTPGGVVVARVPLLERVDSAYDGDVDYAAVIRREVAAYRIVAELRMTPQLLAADVTRTTGPHSWMVLSEATGEDLVALDPAQATALGRFTRGLHALRPGPDPDLVTPLADPASRVLRRLAALERHENLPGTAAGRRAALRSAVDRLPPDRALLHMDLRPSNLRGSPSRLETVLDWSNARLGHPWEEIGRLEAFGMLTDDFLAGYGADRGAFADPAVAAFAFDTHALLASVAADELHDPALYGTSVAGALRCLDSL